MINSESVSDFYREANTAVSFNHKNVLKCLGMSDGPKELPYLVFEYMHFGDLSTILASNRLKNERQNDNTLLLQQVSFLSLLQYSCIAENLLLNLLTYLQF